ncbi:MAG TPA: HAD family hydrolase [Bacillus sp. (in: firmicutes)]|nr:HAD family hydrolase [Bacillus sp. (in: firmicutes)]
MAVILIKICGRIVIIANHFEKEQAMQKQNILFNLDDTLVECNIYFGQIIEEFADQMTKWFDSLTKEEIKQKQLEIDLKSIDEHGLKSERFPESFVHTYQHFCNLTGKKQNKSDIELLRELGFKVFQIPVEPLPYMNETLQRLKEAGHELYLHTGGDEANQRRKIAQLELTTYFEHRIFISEHKDTTALSDILKTIDADPRITWMVGNSLRTDIVPALEMNIHAIYIPAETEWKYNVVEVNVEPKGAFLTLNSLAEVPDAIHKYMMEEDPLREDIPSTAFGILNQEEREGHLFT